VEIQHGIFARIPASENLGLRIVQDITDSESIVNSCVTRESTGMVHKFCGAGACAGHFEVRNLNSFLLLNIHALSISISS
jgi:hypothetical protein